MREPGTAPREPTGTPTPPHPTALLPGLFPGVVAGLKKKSQACGDGRKGKVEEGVEDDSFELKSSSSKMVAWLAQIGQRCLVEPRS